MEKRVNELAEEHGGHWGEHPDHPTSDWVLQVVDDDTRLGYWQWVYDRLENEEFAEEKDEDQEREEQRRFKVDDLVFWSDPLHSVASGHYRIEEINAEGFKIHEEGTGDVRTVAGHELELVGKHEPVQPEDDQAELRAERDRLVEALDLQGGRGVELANEIDELNKQLGEGLAGPEVGWCKTHEKEHFLNEDGSCYESECQHKPDWHSLTLAEDLLPGQVVVDMNCTHCGISGSLRLDPTEIQWSEDDQ